MANPINVILKRNNGTDLDTLFPRTHLGQLYTDNTMETTLSSLIASKIPSTEKGTAGGVASLDSRGQLPFSQVPDVLYGSITPLSVVNANTTLEALSSGLDENAVGSFYSIGSTVDISFTAYSTAAILAPGDEQDFVSPVKFESGDRLVLYKVGSYGWVETDIEAFDAEIYAPSVSVSWDNTGYASADLWLAATYGQHTARPYGSVYKVTNTGLGGAISYWSVNVPYVWGVINASYNVATTVSSGIVTLSNATVYSSMNGSAKVITEDVLYDLIGTATGKIAAGDHVHDTRYYTETEMGTFFAGTTSISGYNKAHWDTAYGWGNHANAGYLTGVTGYTASRAAYFDGTGALTAHPNVTSTELNYLDGVTSPLQTQINTLTTALTNRPEIYYGDGQTGNSVGDLIIEID